MEVGLESEDVSYDAMTTMKCSDLCETSKASAGDDGHRCRFWRYDLAEGEEKRCTLLTKCDNFEYCPPSDCQCGDLGCKDGEEPNDMKPCASGIEFHSSAENPTTTFIRWTCPESPVNPYNPADPIPAGTSCITTHKCHKWTTNYLEVRCDGATDGATGNWKAVPDPIPDGMQEFYNAALGDGTAALKELECKPKDDPDDLLTVNEEGTGGLIRCENPDTAGTGDYRIKAPNKCILLCDYHLGMTIEGVLNEEGNYVFNKVETGEEITQANAADQIKCW